MHEQDMSTNEFCIQHIRYKGGIFENEADVTGLDQGKNTLVTLCYAYKASEPICIMEKTKLQQLVKYVKQKAKTKRLMRKVTETARKCQKTTVDRDSLWL